jgi:alpha-tubulin suppressor-like RCC1 family protein
MTVDRWTTGRGARALLAMTLAGLLALAGCSSRDDEGPATGSATVGAAGGTVEGPDGTRLVIPPDAVTTSTTFRISRNAAGAPELVGINAISPVYEVTPHDIELGGSALFSLPLAAAQLPPGETPILLKASPGKPWRVVTDTQRIAGAISADLDTLSWFVLASCSTSNSAGPGFWVIGAPDCPSNNRLRLELLGANGTPITVSPGDGGVLPPYITVTEPTTLNFRLTWTRPGAGNRTDSVYVTGSPGGFRQGFSSSWTSQFGTASVAQVSSDFSSNFTVTIDPATLAAAGPRQVRINAAADYSTTAFAVGRGNVGAGFSFSTHIPILVRYTGVAPAITQQPTPASVSVVENNGFTLTTAATGPNLSYQWRYFQNANDTAVRLAEGTNNQATYNSPAASIGWNGRLYYAHVCTNRGVGGLERCVATEASTLTVTPFTQPVAITAQPVPRDILETESTTFDATVTGTPTPTLRWHYNVSCTTGFLGLRLCSGTPFADGAGSGPFAGATVAGAATGTLSLSSLPLAANGTQIALRAEQPGFAATWSSVVGLTVRARPVAAGFTQQLSSPRAVQQGGSIDFSVQTSGTAPINYVWAIDGNRVSLPGTIAGGRCAGAVASFPSENVMRLASVPLACDGAIVSVGIDNIATPAGTRPTSTALLNVSAVPTAPTIGTQPAGSTIAEGNRATLSVGYGGTAPITLTLQRFASGSWSDVVSVGSAACASPCSLQTPVLEAADNGAQFRVRLVNAQGSLDSSPVTITVTLVRAPGFTTQPAAATVDAGQTASFSFVAGNDSGSFGYQWLANGQPLADGASVAGNGALQGATVSGASGSGTSGTLTLANVPLGANGVSISVRVTRTAGGQSTQATSSTAALTVNSGIPPNALTATQVVAGYEWSLALRPDRTVWAWGWLYRSDGTWQINGPFRGTPALRPVQIYPAVLTDIRQVTGWYDGFWALKGEPGTTASRLLHWGNARWGSDGRGWDGNGSPAGGGNSLLQNRYNDTGPVEMLLAAGQPVDRVCSIRGSDSRLVMIRAIDDSGATTDCRPGSAKTVWMVGSYTNFLGQHNGLVQKMPGLPPSGQGNYSPPAALFAQEQTSGADMIAIALEDGRAYGLGTNVFNGFGRPIINNDPRQFGSTRFGGASGPELLRSEWGTVRSFGSTFYYSLFALRPDGSVMTSGYTNNDELGLGDLPQGALVPGPVRVLAETCSATSCTEFLTGVTAIASTGNSGTTLALKNGQILGWGSGNNGLLGPGFTSGAVQPYPRSVPSAVSGLTALSASLVHALVIGPGNVVYSWGYGLRGALGDGVDGNTRTAPGLVTVVP